MPIIQRTRFDELKATRQLPSPTGVAMALLRLANDENTSVAEISRVLETDPVMAGRVLKMANAATYGAARRLAAVREAVARLGFASVRNLALGFSLISQNNRGLCPAFDYPLFWSRSLATAIAAKVLSRFVKGIPPDEAFTCGLLCQIGSLALASIYPQAYGNVLTECGDGDPGERVRLERQEFATDHNELTAAMLQDWKLPADLVEATRYHEQGDTAAYPQGIKAHTLTRVLHVAARLAALCIAEPCERERLLLDLLSRAELLSVDPAAFLAACDQAAADWRTWGQLLEIVTSPLPSLVKMAEARMAAPAVSVALAAEDIFQRSPESTSTDDVPLADEAMDVPEMPPSTRSNILVVDDDRIELRLLGKLLTDAGHAVATARTGAEALRQVLENPPQLVITDWQMPEMDGVSLCRALRQTKVGRQVYVIILTGCDDEEHLVEGFEAGADDFVIKPFQPRTLLARIRAGQRVILLQDEVNRDKEELRRYAAEMAIVNRKLQQAAYTDALTGLPNRRAAIEQLTQEWASADSGRSLACLMIDVDHFKKVNDTFGHETGDVVLQATAAALQGAVRQESTVCRLGGEEFLVLCPKVDLDAAAIVGERLCRRIEANVITAPPFHQHVTISVGVAVRQRDMRSWEDLLRAADQAVYEAKQSGRNRVCVAPPPAGCGRS